MVCIYYFNPGAVGTPTEMTWCAGGKLGAYLDILRDRGYVIIGTRYV